MTPIFQTILGDNTKGDCHRATIASLFNLEIDQVPHFRLFPDKQWSFILCGFLWGLGYNWDENGYPKTHNLSECENVGGFFEACVPSSLPDSTHSVIINIDGVVVHDPCPKQFWKSKNVSESGELKHWAIFKKINGRD